MKMQSVLLAFAVGSLWSRVGLADDEEIAVELAGSSDILPAVVCVAAPEPATNAMKKATVGKDIDTWQEAPVVFGTPDHQGSAAVWRFAATDSKPAAVDAKTSERARALLHMEPPPTIRFKDQSACAPAVSLQKTQNSVLCQANPLAGPNATGVAVVALEFGTTIRRLGLFTVDGNLLTIRLEKAVKVGTPSVRLAGGHYQQTSVQPVVAQRATLALEPTCYERELALPELESNGSSEVEIALESVRPAWKARVAVSEQSVRIALPPLQHGKEGVLSVTVPPRRGSGTDERAAGRFEARWGSKEPPVALALSAKNLSFRWRVPCEFPFAQECPRARLEGSGLTSDGSRHFGDDGDFCAYRVETRSGSIALPSDVEFTMKQLPAWHAKLHRVNQAFDEYVSAEARMFRVTMPWASKKPLTADKIDYVEILGPTGARHIIKPQYEAVISLPYATCGARMSYRFSGTREFAWGQVNIGKPKNGSAVADGGTLTLESPDVTASTVSLGLSAGGGFLFSVNRSESRPYAQAELSLRLRPKRRERTGFHRFISAPDYEFALTYLLASEPYRPLRNADNQEDESLESVAYNRFALSAFAFGRVSDTLFLGGGAGVGLGYAFLSSDDSRVGDLRFFAMPSLRARYQVSQRLSLVTTARFLFPDRLYEHSSPNDFQGTPRSSWTHQEWAFWDAGLQGWL